MKTEFQARPIYLKREDRIKSHFLVCFLALLVFRLLKQKLPGYSSQKLTQVLRSLKLMEISSGDYTPIFKRTDLTDELHEEFGFRLDRELIPQKTLTKIIKQTKKQKSTQKIKQSKSPKKPNIKAFLELFYLFSCQTQEYNTFPPVM